MRCHLSELQSPFKPVHDPHVAIPCGERRGVLVDEIEAAEADVGLPRIFRRQGDDIGDVGRCLVGGNGALRFEDLRKKCGAAGDERLEIRGRGGLRFDVAGEGDLELRGYRPWEASRGDGRRTFGSAVRRTPPEVVTPRPSADFARSLATVKAPFSSATAEHQILRAGGNLERTGDRRPLRG